MLLTEDRTRVRPCTTDDASNVRIRATAKRGPNRAAGSISEQCRDALRRAAELLAMQGLCMEDVVHVTYIVRDPDAFPACFPLLRHAFGDARPAVTLHLVRASDRPGARIEIELLARRAAR